MQALAHERISGLAHPDARQQHLGLTTDGIEVRSSGEGAGVPCGRVDGDKGQQLRVSLTGSGLAGATADFMELDIEAKGDVIVVADLYLRGDLVASGIRAADGHSVRLGSRLRRRRQLSLPRATGACHLGVRCVRASREEQRRFFLALRRGRRHGCRARGAR